MCNGIFNERLAPLSSHHLDAVEEMYPHQAIFAGDMYDVLTKDLAAQANLLVSLVALKEQFDQGVRGIFSTFGRVLYAPLSIVAKTGDDEWTRFRPRAVNELHTSFLSFMMAKPNRLALEGALARHDLALSQGHCCGILFGDPTDLAQYESSRLFAIRNRMRSRAESRGMPVVNCPFDSIPKTTSDLGPTERQFYKLYDAMFERIPQFGPHAYHNAQMDDDWEEIIGAIPHTELVVESAQANAA